MESPRSIYILTLVGIMTVLYIPHLITNVYAATTSCTLLTSNLYYGSTDFTMGGQIRSLQNYLFATGYLTAQPNGVFGPATLSAVKKFQSAYGIQTTGVTGPLTRAAMQKNSCSITPTTPVPPISPPAPLATTTTPAINPSAIVVTAPPNGTSVAVGDPLTITWTAPANTIAYSILLEDEHGVGKGYISLGGFPDKRYVWRVGTMLSSTDAQSITPGNYRIRVQNQVKGPTPFDQTSNVFTIIQKPLIIQSVFPRTTLVADAQTSAVLYGSGFINTSFVYFDNSYNGNTRASYISPDGTIFVFTVPQGISTGYHTIRVSNVYDLSATSTQSNPVGVTITAP